MSNFLEKDEFLLLMVHCEDRANGFERQHILTVEERTSLREVGVKTAHEQPSWASIEPQQGQYNWGYLDNIIDRNRRAGLKSLIQVSGWRIPNWIPIEWRPKALQGTWHDDMLSIWNEEAQSYNDNYYRLLYERYNSADIMWFFGEFQGGEGVIPPSQCWHDRAALDSYSDFVGTRAIPDMAVEETMAWLGESCLKHVLRKNAILQPRYNEVWSCLQRLMDRWSKAYGNFIHPELLIKYRELYPDGNIVLLQYTYFDGSHDLDCINFVDHLVNISGADVIVEAMFCAGLPTTTPKAIAKGFRGQIVHPANAIEGESFTKEMLDAIRNSHNAWKESREWDL